MTRTINSSKSFLPGLITAAGASLCCITPVLAFLGGASGLASSFSWIEPFRPYLIALTILVFAFAWYQKLKPQKQVDCDCEKPGKNSFIHSKTFLTVVTVFAGLLLAFPYYANAFYPKPGQTAAIVSNKSDIVQAQFTIKGMTCEGCTQHVNSEIAKVNGVVSFQTSYDKARSIVKFDNDKTSIDSIAAAINSTGYKVTSQLVIKN